MPRPSFPLQELLRRGVRKEWIDNNKWLTLGDGTRHWVHKNHIEWLRIYLNTIDRHVPPNAQVSVLVEDENLQKSRLVDIMTAYETRRRGAASSSSSSPTPPPRRGTKGKRRFDALHKSQPQPVRKRRHVTSPSPSSHASSPPPPAPPSAQPSTSHAHHHPAPPPPPAPVAGPSGPHRRTRARRRPVPQSQTDRRTVDQGYLPNHVKRTRRDTVLWQEPLRPDWGRNGTASDALRTGLQNANVPRPPIGPVRPHCRNCDCPLSSAPGRRRLCDLCGRYADRMVSLSQCCLDFLIMHSRTVHQCEGALVRTV